MKNVVIFGSRHLGHVPKNRKLTDEEKATYEAARAFIKEELIALWKQWKDLYGPVRQVLQGGANGLDSIADEIAPMITGKKSKLFKADWFKGPSAGVERNERMANEADGGIYIKLPRSSGSGDMIERLESRGLPVLGSVITLDDLDFHVGGGIKQLYLEDMARSAEKSARVRNRTVKKQ